jgi:alpha-glucosidase
MDHFADLVLLHLAVPSQDGEFVSYLHEDDGVTRAFERGAYLRTTFRVKRSGQKLRLVASVSGRGFPEFQRKSLRIVFHGAALESAALDGRAHYLEQQMLEFANSGQGFEFECVLEPEPKETRALPLLRKVAN